MKRALTTSGILTGLFAIAQVALGLGDYRNRTLANLLWAAIGVSGLVLLGVLLLKRWPKLRWELRPVLTGWRCVASVYNDTSVSLELLSHGGKLRPTRGVDCRVADPDGNVSVLPASEFDPSYQERMSCQYPHLFATAVRPLRSDSYTVEWRRPGRLFGSRLLADYNFEIAPGAPGWYVSLQPIHLVKNDHMTIYLYQMPGAEPLEGLMCEVTDPDGVTT